MKITKQIISVVIATITLAVCAHAQTATQKPAEAAKGAEYSATALGKKYIAFGVIVNSTTADDASNDIGLGALLEVSYNVFKSENDTFGLDLALPVTLNWQKVYLGAGSAHLYDLEFPLVARPYYRFDFNSFALTPYLELGFGGVFNHIDGGNGYNEWSYMYLLGVGLEFCFMKDFALTPRYQHRVIESDIQNAASNSSKDILALAFTWQVNKNWALIVEYEHAFHQASGISSDLGVIKGRYEF